MNKPFIDTNLIIRLLTGEPEKQAVAARSFFESVDRGEITPYLATIVVAEVVFVLKSFYEFEKTAIIDALLNLITSPAIAVQDREIVLSALTIFRDKNIHFVDCYAAAYSQITQAPVASFDSDFDKIEAVKRLPLL